MDELDLFRDFRVGVAPPSPDAERRASTRLAQVIERGRGRQTRPHHAIRTRRARLTLAVAVLAVAGAATLLVSSPWRTSPGFLERAEAALTPPDGTILHIRWEELQTSRDFGCTVNHAPAEVWADQAPPYRFRVVGPVFPTDQTGGRGMACAGRMTIERGGTLEPPDLVTFQPPDTLVHDGSVFESWDVVASLRDAIASGNAYDEGKVARDGRIVERIRLTRDCPAGPCSPEPLYAYVDPETFYPVELNYPDGGTMTLDGHELRFDIVYRILAYEYLPRTGANVALTDIRAQHPDATGP